MKLIKKYQQGKPVLQNDSPAQVAITTLGKNSPAGQYIRANSANTQQIINGETPHYIFTDNPRAFNYNGELMVRGSELLKYPQLYTHMGWTDTATSGILPEQYYRIGNDGSLDTTHYTAFSNTDTYTPIEADYLPYVLNQAFAANGNYGQVSEKRRQGQVVEAPENRLAPVLTGYVPGADAMAANGNLEGATQALAGQTTAMNTALGFTGPGFIFYSPLIFGSGYDRARAAENWKDYALGGTEMLMSVAPWLYKGYVGIRSATSPIYRLGQQSQKAFDTGLDWDAYYGYKPDSNINPNFHIFDVTNRQNALVLPNTTHIHSPEIRTLVDIRPKILEKALKEGTVLHGYPASNLKPGQFSVVEFTHPDGYVMTPGSVKTISEYPTIHYRRTGTYDPELEPDWGYKPDRRHISEEKTRSGEVISATQHSPNRYVYAGDIDFRTNKGVARIHADEKGNIVIDGIYPKGTIKLFNSSTASKVFKEIESDQPSAVERYQQSVSDFNKGHAFVEDYYDPLERPIINPYRPTKNNNRVSFVNFNPKQATVTSGLEDWNSAVSKIMDYTNTTEFGNRAKRAGLKVEDIQDSFRRAFKNTLVNDVGYRENPVGYIGESTFDDFNGQDLFQQLQQVDKNLSGMTEEQFVSKLTPEERIMYDNAKQKKIQVALSSNNVEDWQTALEEALHRVQYSEDDEILKIINDYNESLTNGIKARSVEFADPRELVVRAREAARMRSLVSNQELKHFYASRFGQNIPDDQIDKMFYQDLLSGNPRLIRAFPQLQNSKTNRLLNQLNNQYEHNGSFWQLLKDVVYNNESNRQNDYSLA